MNRLTLRPASRLPRPALVALALGAVLAVGACSSDPSPTPSTSAPAPGPSASVVTPATTPVPPPTAGTTRSAVPSATVVRRKPVALDARGQAADDVTVQLTKISAIQAKGQGPGEVSGPALAFTIAVRNGTTDRLSLAAVAVNVAASDDTPASQMTAKPAKPFTGSLDAGASGTAVYVFDVAKSKRKPVTVEVAVRPGDPVVVFRGSAA